MSKNTRLKTARINKGLSQEELAEKLGSTQAYIAGLESGKGFSQKRAIEIAKILDVDFKWLWFDNDSSTILDQNSLKAEDDSAPYYPNVNASAGLSFLTENGNQQHPEEYIKVPGLKVDAFINVFGNSMMPKYQSGQVIGIKKIEKDMIHFGYAYVIEMLDGEAYIKYIQPGKDKDHWSLESENRHYKPTEFHLSKIRRVFKIKSVLTRESL